MKFSKPIPYNASDKTLGPVSMKLWFFLKNSDKRIRLTNASASLVPGSGWEGIVDLTTSFIQDHTTFQIDAALVRTLSLNEYEALVLKKKPIRIKSTLAPEAALPGMGIPVPVGGAPVMDQIDITIPGLPPPALDVKVEPGGTDGSGLLSAIIMATLQFPLKFTDAEIAGAVKGISINVTSGKQSATEGAESFEGTWKKRVITSTVGPTNKSQGPIEVTVSTTVCGVRLQKIVPIEFKPPLRYVLNINPGSVTVKREKAASFIAQVFEEFDTGKRVLANNATIKVDGDTEYLSLSPTQGSGRLECTISQQKVNTKKETTCTVHASVKTDSMQPQSVPIHLETIDYGSLDVVFVPATKNHLNPFIKTDHVELRAKLVPPPGSEPVKADIDFSLEQYQDWNWLSQSFIPSTGSDAEGTTRTTQFYGRLPSDPETVLPPSQNVIVKAIYEGAVITETKVPVMLDPKPTLTAEPHVVNLLANAKSERSGRPEAITSALIKLSVNYPGDEEWKISAEYAETEKKLISSEEKDSTPSSKDLLFTVSDPIPLPERKPGVTAWQQTVSVTPKASLGDLQIQGEPISINILHEGLYVKKIYEYNREKNRLDVTAKGKVTIAAYDPAEKRAPLVNPVDVADRHIFPYVTFTAMEWDGKGLVAQENIFITADTEAQRSRDTGKAGIWWNTIFLTLKESFIEVIYSGDLGGELHDKQNASTGKWHIVFQKQIPGNGEKASGFIKFWHTDYYDPSNPEAMKNWQYELPITLLLGSPDELKTRLSTYEEAARCNKIIDRCFPEQYRKNLRKELDALKNKGAEDYRVFSIEIHKTAWKIWEEEQKEFLIWDTAWAVLIPVAEGAKFLGDLAFNALVMVYTAGLGPYAQFAISNFVSTIQSESMAVYAYYIEHGGGRDFQTCILEYVNNNWFKFLTDLISGETIDTYYAGQIEVDKVLKEPKKYAKIVGWLWLWKFQYHLAEGIGKDDGGYCAAAYKATQDLGMLSINLLVGKFVEVHGRTDLQDLWPRVRAKEYFGGKVAPSVPKKDKADKDKAKQDQIDQEKLKAAKEEAKKKAEKLKEEAKEIEKQTQEKLKEIEKQTQEKLKDIKNQTEEKLKEIEKQKQEQIKQIENERQKKLNEIGEQAHKPEVYKETPLSPDEYRTITYKDAPNANVDKLTSGMTKEHLDAAKQIAKDENVDLLIRSTTPHAEKLISSGQADPKPEYVKCKTINELDLKLFPSLKPEDLGKVGYFEPKMPDNIKPGDPGYNKLKERFDQRSQEVKDQADHIKNHQDLNQGTGQKIRVENGVVQKVLPDGTPKDITGDYDVMGVIDRSTGKPVTGKKGERIYNRMKSEMNVQHPWQSQWDYRSESKTVPPGSPEGTQSPYDVKKGIDETILNSHMEGKEKSEPLIKIGGDGNITGAWIAGVEVP